MKRGFEFAEVMTGTFERADGTGGGHLRFDVVATAPSVWVHLGDGKCRLSGTIDMDGLATAAPVDGEMTLALFRRRLIRYDFTFVGDDRRPYRFAGQKDIRLLRFRETIARLPAKVTDTAGRLVARCVLHFDIDADLPAFVASWRLA